MSGQQASVRLGRSVRWLNHLLNLESAPHIDDIAHLARLLQVDPAQLAFGEIPEPAGAR